MADEVGNVTEVQAGDRPRLAVVRGVNDITAIRLLTETEWRDYQDARSQLQRFAAAEHLLVTVQGNFVEARRAMADYAQAQRFGVSRVAETLEDMMANLNRLVLNFLSAFRTFVDHHETNLKHRHGDSSETVRAFIRMRSEAYDSSFSYRFLYHLRNYSQHCGMPIHTISLDAKVVDPVKHIIEQVLLVACEREALLRWDKWKPGIRREIESCPDRFPIWPHIANVMEGIRRISRGVLGGEALRVAGAARLVLRICAPARVPGCAPCLMVPKKVGEGMLNVNLQWPPIRVAEEVLGLTEEPERAPEPVAKNPEAR